MTNHTQSVATTETLKGVAIPLAEALAERDPFITATPVHMLRGGLERKIIREKIEAIDREIARLDYIACCDQLADMDEVTELDIAAHTQALSAERMRLWQELAQ